ELFCIRGRRRFRRVVANETSTTFRTASSQRKVVAVFSMYIPAANLLCACGRGCHLGHVLLGRPAVAPFLAARLAGPATGKRNTRSCGRGRSIPVQAFPFGRVGSQSYRIGSGACIHPLRDLE